MFTHGSWRRLLRLVPVLVLAAWSIPLGAQPAPKDAADRDRLVSALEIKPGSIVAEIGAGTGQLTVLLARVVGSSGRIYSNELDPERLTSITKAVDEAGLHNVTTVEGKERTANLPDECCDGIFMRDVYHHFSDPPAMNASLLQALRPGGRLAIIDFTPPPVPNGENPPGHRGEDNHHGITRATLEGELRAAGFEIVSGAEVSRDVFVVARRRS
jgi:ubiquinone/menaquinone biosynthesis C-methylase UbiE